MKKRCKCDRCRTRRHRRDDPKHHRNHKRESLIEPNDLQVERDSQKERELNEKGDLRGRRRRREREPQEAHDVKRKDDQKT